MADTLRRALDLLGGVVLGKDLQLRLSLACLLARGHLLIEDIPGIGKTTLAKALAVVLGLDFKRVQFTNDLLPGDLLGVSVFDASEASFVFHPGPVFTNVLLADEINRGTPRTQSALLEVMEEQQVSLDNSTRLLPWPPRTPWTRPAPTPCPSPSWTASCSASASATPTSIPSWSSWAAARTPAGRRCPRP